MSMLKPSSGLRVAVVGAGKMANLVHYPSLASLPDVEIIAICDLDPLALQRTADQYGIQGRYHHYQEMIEAVAPDAVYALGQPHHLYEVWIWCLEHGLNLFVEKPLGLTLHQAQSLAYLADQHGCITQVGFQRRSTPLAVHLYQQCIQRGPVHHALCRFYKNAPTPFLAARDHLLDDTIHSIDTLRWVSGGEVVGLYSSTRRRGVPDINYVSAVLEFDSGANGILINSWTSGRRIFSMEIHAPGIVAEMEHEVGGTIFADGDTTGVKYTAKEVAGSDQFFIYAGFQAKHREFIDAIREHRLPSSHFGDALHTMEVATEILARAQLADAR